jgi:hypothetical protein
MPRTGGGIYTKPFPDVTSGTTIASAVHNGIVADVETDLNAARPIIAGGTGAVNALGARANLQVERAMQTVTNFDSHVWETGSFFAAIGATAGPPTPAGGTTTENFFGIAYGDAVNMFVEARSLTTGLNYVRRKTGTWSNWALDGGDKLSNTGGTITGNLQITGTLGVTGTTTLGTVNAGNINSSGTIVSAALNTGPLSTTTITTNGNTITAGPINSGYITSTGMTANGDISTSRPAAPTTGVIFLGNSGHYLFFNGTNYELPAGSLSVGGNVTAGTFNGNLNGTANYATSAGSAPAAGGNASYADSAGTAGSAGYATNAGSAGYATSAGSAPAAGGTASAANSLVTSASGRTWSVYGGGESAAQLIIDDSSAGLRAAHFTPYGANGPGTIDLYMPYHTQTTNGVNGTWTNNFMCQFVSSGRYKTGIQDLSHDDADKILAFRPVTFRSKCPIDDPDQVKIGLIAEEVEDIEPRLVQYDYTPDAYENVRGKEGEPIRHNLRKDAKKQVMGLDYNAIVVLLLRKVQEQEERIARLEAKLSQ